MQWFNAHFFAILSLSVSPPVCTAIHPYVRRVRKLQKALRVRPPPSGVRGGGAKEAPHWQRRRSCRNPIKCYRVSVVVVAGLGWVDNALRRSAAPAIKSMNDVEEQYKMSPYRKDCDCILLR